MGLAVFDAVEQKTLRAALPKAKKKRESRERPEIIDRRFMFGKAPAL